jgi:hypothetical protein
MSSFIVSDRVHLKTDPSRKGTVVQLLTNPPRVRVAWDNGATESVDPLVIDNDV